MTSPNLQIIDASNSNDDEFLPLPYYPFDERPITMPLDTEEAATAIHLAEGELLEAAQLLKVPIIRLRRLVQGSPRLQRVLEESYGIGVIRAVSIPLRTLKNPNSDQRALEWASTKILQSRAALGHPLSPAPAGNTVSNSLTLNAPQRTVTFRWRTDADDVISTHEEKTSDDAG